MIKQLTQYVEDNTSFVIGTNLFAGHRLPDGPAENVCLLERDPSENYFDIPEREDKVIQCLSRAETYFTARSNAYIVHKLLRRNSGITLPVIDGDTFLVLTMEAISSPRFIGVDKNGFFEFSGNYIVRVEEQ